MSIIRTIKQNCRRCYSCVRECPAKAIRIVDGQASVVTERCICCGTCTVVCSQGAKTYVSGVEPVQRMLVSGQPVAALLAPSFPADPMGSDPGRLVGALRQAGFQYVVEVAYGADLVSAAYRHFIATHPNGLRIATACPSVVEYVRKYNPDLIGNLIPIVSPMIATALAVKAEYGEQVQCVFIGPCIAKKREAHDPALGGVLSEVLTFQELHGLFFQQEIRVEEAVPSAFDPPQAGMGRVFPLVGGLLKSAGVERSAFNPDVVVLSGQQETVEVLCDLRAEEGESLLVEPMICRGCYSGPGLGAEGKRFGRKRRVAAFIAATLQNADTVSGAKRATGDGTAHFTARAIGGSGGEGWGGGPERLEVQTGEGRTFDLTRIYQVDDQRLEEPTEAKIKEILSRTNKFTREDELNCGACGYLTCRAKAVAVYRNLAEEAMCLPFMVEQAERVCHELKVPWLELRDVHRHLVNTDKLASMGQMAAGVAHELNNPLGTILLYTSILARKLKDRDDLKHDLKLLISEAERCKKIIGMLLDFARQNRVLLEPTKLCELVTRATEKARFALEQANGSGSKLEMTISADPDLSADIDRDQMGQVLINLIKNAVEAMEGGSGAIRITAGPAPDSSRVRLSVSDQGRGIPLEARDKVFQPFFTTKSIGKGTGLGLPIVYGIVKMHRGSIWFETEVDRGTTFIIELPKSQSIGRSFVRDSRPQDHVRG